VEYRAAESPSEILRACGMVYDAFLRQGLIPPDPSRIYVHHEALVNPACVAVALEDDGRMVATAGGILDGPGGLPLDREYPDEMAVLRAVLRAGHTVAECGVIASDSPTSLRTMMGVISVLLSWGREFGATAVVTSCHPHHATFYTRGYGLRQVGPERHYERLSGAPVVMLAGVLAEMAAQSDLRGVRHWREHPADLSRLMEPARLREVA